jgi:hypothetical protein
METKNNTKNIKETNIDKLVERSVDLISEWTEKEAGDFSMWMDLIQPISVIVMKQIGGTHIENVELTIEIIQKIGENFYEENKDKLSEDSSKILNVIMSENGKLLLKSSTNFIGKLLREIDTNGDGNISQIECSAFLKKTFPCCFPVKS